MSNKDSEGPEPQPHHHVAYIDGSWSNDLESASWGIVIYQNGNIIHEDYSLVDYSKLPEDAQATRQVAGELMAAMQAINWALKNNTRVFIVYDYIGIKNWAISEWKTKKKTTKFYKKFMQENIKCISGWRWVRGHTGVLGNEKADKLAKAAIEETYKE